MKDCHLLLTDQVNLASLEGHRVVPDASKPLPIGGSKERRSAMSITKLKSAYYPDFGLVNSYRHCELKVNRNTTLVQPMVSHTGGLNKRDSTSLNIVPPQIMGADYNEYKISETDFKNLYPIDFEDLYLLRLQGQLNHLSGADKVNLFNIVNLWISNIVIRKRMEDLQLEIESYQMKLNLTQPDWDASDFLFKEDYTIVSKLSAVIYRDINDQKKMMRETEVQKFCDGTLTRIIEKLDHMVKDFKLFKYNQGMETRI
uniref:Uncharacterized protein n=1 Tax=Tanacetum cinerariifolium TaxID=118510 RepID=A0A6L2NK69_TANCI|nr:hypothetical protein [Tanacetum cinerariifolium]